MGVLSTAGGSGCRTAGALLPLSLFYTLAGASVCPAAPAQTPEEGRYRISVNVSLVVLQATVTDGKGRFVPGLQRGDFQVFEEGIAQQITLFRHEDVPVTVGLVVDHSGSMNPKLRDVIAAANTFARASNPDDQMFVVDFNEKVWLGLPAGSPFTSDAIELENAISRPPIGGKTALYDAIAVALQRLDQGTRDKKILIVISDGGDNASRHKRSEVMKMSVASNAIIYAIGLFNEDDPDRNPAMLQSLARVTGGESFFPKQTREVVTLCERIAKDIRNQYTLGYTPPPSSPNKTYRTIRVVARSPQKGRLFVRTRKGYIPAVLPSESQAAPRGGK